MKGNFKKVPFVQKKNESESFSSISYIHIPYMRRYSRTARELSRAYHARAASPLELALQHLDEVAGLRRRRRRRHHSPPPASRLRRLVARLMEANVDFAAPLLLAALVALYTLARLLRALLLRTSVVAIAAVSASLAFVRGASWTPTSHHHRFLSTLAALTRSLSPKKQKPHSD